MITSAQILERKKAKHNKSLADKLDQYQKEWVKEK